MSKKIEVIEDVRVKMQDLLLESKGLAAAIGKAIEGQDCALAITALCVVVAVQSKHLTMTKREFLEMMEFYADAVEFPATREAANG